MERGAYHRRLPRTTSAGAVQPEPVRIAPRPAAPAGNNGAPAAATVAAGGKSDASNSSSSSNNNNNGNHNSWNIGSNNNSNNNNNNSNSHGGEGAAGAGVVREQDRFMPIANVIRIMRRVLPTHAKIADDAKETIQECVSEYISFITSEANERCQQEQRKTITAEDLLWAMSKLGFDDYVEPLSLYLQRYREVEGDHRGSLRGEPLLKPLKRATSDSGLYGPPQPGYQAGPHDHQNHHPLPHQYFYVPQPQLRPSPHLPTPVFFPGAAGGGSSSTTGAGGLIPGSYYREAGGPSQGGSSSSQAHPSAGFDPFSPYK